MPRSGATRIHAIYVAAAARAFLFVLDRAECIGITNPLHLCDYHHEVPNLLRNPSGHATMFGLSIGRGYALSGQGMRGFARPR